MSAADVVVIEHAGRYGVLLVDDALEELASMVAYAARQRQAVHGSLEGSGTAARITDAVATIQRLERTGHEPTTRRGDPPAEPRATPPELARLFPDGPSERTWRTWLADMPGTRRLNARQSDVPIDEARAVLAARGYSTRVAS